MAADNFTACLDFTLSHEGGYVDHPRDPGGATNMGITHATLARWRRRPVTKADVRALRRDEAARIYKALYWDRVDGPLLPRGLDLCAFDSAVNSGEGRAKKWLANRGRGDVAAQISRMCALRMSFVRGLRTWGTFGKGWARRIAGVEARALRMALGSSAAARKRMNATAATAKTKAARQSAAATVSATATVASPAATSAVAPVEGADMSVILFAVAVFAVAAIIGFVAWRSSQAQSARAAAIEAELRTMDREELEDRA